MKKNFSISNQKFILFFSMAIVIPIFIFLVILSVNSSFIDSQEKINYSREECYGDRKLFFFSENDGGNGGCHSQADLRQRCLDSKGAWRELTLLGPLGTNKDDQEMATFKNNRISSASCLSGKNVRFFFGHDEDCDTDTICGSAYSCKCPDGQCIDSKGQCIPEK